jgi:MFS family permease
MPAWMDIVGRAVPTAIRGRFFALSSLLASVGGLLGSVGTAYILGAVAPPASYGVCFLIAAAFMGLSYLALALVREPETPPPPPAPPFWTHLRSVPPLLRRDGNLRRFLVARALGMAGAMATAFYTVHALRLHGAPEWEVGVFTAAQFAGQIAGNALLGWLADRAGHRLVLVTGMAATVAANAVALAAPSLALYPVVFVLTGVQVAAVNVSGLNILLEFAPTEQERPTYVGLGNTSLGPVACLAPLAAGVIVDGLGFAAVFAMAGLCAALALAVLLRVRDPRHTALAPPSMAT